MKYDVIITGAGPAGTAAGFDLVMAGYSVLLLDRQEFPRKKPCAGGLTPKAVNQYAYDISGLIERTCHEIIIHRPDGSCFSISRNRPLCHMTQRKDLDLFALNRFRSAGGSFQIAGRIHAMVQGASSVTLHTSGGSFAADYLVGADGANSRIRTLLNEQNRPYRVRKLFGLEADVLVSRPDHVSMAFAFFRDLPGYFWIFPKKDHVNIGIFSRTRTPQVSVRKLAAFAGRYLDTTHLSDVTGYPIATGGGRLYQSPGAGRVLLAGDAAGFAESVFGEGIYFAVKSGRVAAAAIMGALTKKNPALSVYSRSLADMRLDLQVSRYAAAALYRWTGPCLHLAGIPAVHRHFSSGYAAGQPLSRIFLP
jgi:geranylgeranyl reductase family protein